MKWLIGTTNASSRTLSDFVSKRSKTAEKLHTLDVAGAREGYQKMEISYIGFIPSNHNLAAGLTKPKQSKLLYVMSIFMLHDKVKQWIANRILNSK